METPEPLALLAPPAEVPQARSAAPKRGRPKKISRMTIEEADEAIAANLPMLLERALDLARGVMAVEYKLDKETGEITDRIYRQPPDKEMIKYLTERVLGRVPQRMELTGSAGGPVQVLPWLPRSVAENRGLINEITTTVRELPSGS